MHAELQGLVTSHNITPSGLNLVLVGPTVDLGKAEAIR
jgi:hypothetical protein